MHHWCFVLLLSEEVFRLLAYVPNFSLELFWSYLMTEGTLYLLKQTNTSSPTPGSVAGE